MKNNKILCLFLCIITAYSCSKDQEIPSEAELSDYELDVIDYFKDIALGFEFGNASMITRKWQSDLTVFLGGQPPSELRAELQNITGEINTLATDGFKVVISDDSLVSNFYIFFGSGTDYAEKFPSQSNLVSSNWGLFSVFWNGQNQLNSGHMYVDIVRASTTEQKHLLREEFTQSLGLARDSPLYIESIFQSAWTTTSEYATIDADLIRLLYHPKMSVGLNADRVEEVLKDILANE